MESGESLAGSAKCCSTQLRVCRFASPFNGGPTFMPAPFTRWQSAQLFAWNTSAPAVANSGAFSIAEALSAFSFSRNAAREFSCASLS